MKLPDYFNTIAGLAAVAIIVAGVGGFMAILIGALLGRPLTPEAFALADRFIVALFGLAIGAGVGAGTTAVRLVKTQELQASAAQELVSLQRHNASVIEPPPLSSIK